MRRARHTVATRVGLYIALLAVSLLLGERIGSWAIGSYGQVAQLDAAWGFTFILVFGLISVAFGVTIENRLLRKACNIEYWYPPISLGFSAGVVGAIVWGLDRVS